MKYAVDIEIRNDVAEALDSGKPVIAIESGLIAHSSRWPNNARLAIAMQTKAREFGAIPAVCAIIDGKIKIGLADDELDALCKADREVCKASLRDISLLLAQKRMGALTASATICVAAHVGIRVMASGGLGGVHRGAQQSMDVSPDLWALANTPVAVVCAGVKSILDIGLTLEKLETYGIPVIGYDTACLPGFLTRETGFAVDASMSDVDMIAKAMRNHWSLGGCGMVIANPIPEDFSVPRDALERATEKAASDAIEMKIAGKDATSFLLARIKESIGADAIRSAVFHLSVGNAGLAARIATSMASEKALHT